MRQSLHGGCVAPPSLAIDVQFQELYTGQLYPCLQPIALAANC